MVWRQMASSCSPKLGCSSASGAEGVWEDGFAADGMAGVSLSGYWKTKSPRRFGLGLFLKVFAVVSCLESTQATGPKRFCFGHHNNGGGFDVVHRVCLRS